MPAYTLEEAAKYLKTHKQKVQKLYDEGRLVGSDLAVKGEKQRCLRFSEAALELLLNSPVLDTAKKPKAKTPRRQREPVKEYFK